MKILRPEGLASRRCKAIVLLSGGLDSSVAAALAISKGRQLTALSIDYGQSHRIELKAAKRQAKRLEISRQIVLRLPLGAIAKGALVDGSALNLKGPKAGKPSSYVSFRNGIFLSLAAALAEAEEALEIWGGWCGQDFGGYPDCREDFFEAMDEVMRLGSWQGRRGKPFRILAPLARLSKAETLRLGASLGVDFGATWTCYAPKQGHPCGRCDACRIRAAGFEAAGLKDSNL
jgi:7-cyano-7-deazaguanine synthase